MGGGGGWWSGRPARRALVGAVVAGAVLASTASGSAATKKVTAGGVVHCSAVGTVHMSPKLGAVATATKFKVHATVACSTGTTGNDAVIVTSGKLTVTTNATAACTSTSFGVGTAKAAWTASGGKVASSKLTVSAATVTNGTNVALTIRGPGGAQTGSYRYDAWQLHVVGDSTTGGLCGAASKGFAFTHAGSTLDITIANPASIPIEHVIVLMQENRSADHYIGRLPGYDPEPTTGNPDPTNPTGPAILPFHNTSYCEVADLAHSWNQNHQEVNGGAMDGFTTANALPSDPNGHRTMGYYDSSDLPFYYGLFSTFATGDRYFSAAPTPTFPNRLFLLAGTSAGHIVNDSIGTNIRSIFELLDEAGVSWKIYQDEPSGLSYASLFFKYVNDRKAAHVFPTSQYYSDLANNALPQVSYVDPRMLDRGPRTDNDEHPKADVQIGQKFVADHVNALLTSSSWASSALFLTWDENGGYYDHVAPPAAVKPDNIPPNLQAGDVPGAFDVDGARVPAVVVSPYSRPSFVSHVVDDHTSILKFIEKRFGLPSLTARDAAADPMLDHFNFTHAAFASPPTLPAAVVDPAKLAACPTT